MLLLWILFVIYVSVLSCCLVCSLQPCDHLLGKGKPLGSLVFDVFFCFCHFPMWCPGSGVFLDCINSCSLPSSLLWCKTIILSVACTFLIPRLSSSFQNFYTIGIASEMSYGRPLDKSYSSDFTTKAFAIGIQKSRIN